MGISNDFFVSGSLITLNVNPEIQLNIVLLPDPVFPMSNKF